MKTPPSPEWSPGSASIQGMLLWPLGVPLESPERAGLCLAFTNLYGLPVLGFDDIPRLVGPTAGHIFTKRGQTYWKSIYEGTWNMLGPHSPPTTKATGGPSEVCPRHHLDQVTKFSITKDPADIVCTSHRKCNHSGSVLTEESNLILS